VIAARLISPLRLCAGRDKTRWLLNARRRKFGWQAANSDNRVRPTVAKPRYDYRNKDNDQVSSLVSVPAKINDKLSLKIDL
jgi:hypothetical protein